MDAKTLFRKLHDARSLLRVHGAISDAENERVVKRIYKRLREVSRREEQTAKAEARP